VARASRKPRRSVSAAVAGLVFAFFSFRIPSWFPTFFQSCAAGAADGALSGAALGGTVIASLRAGTWPCSRLDSCLLCAGVCPGDHPDRPRVAEYASVFGGYAG